MHTAPVFSRNTCSDFKQGYFQGRGLHSSMCLKEGKGKRMVTLLGHSASLVYTGDSVGREVTAHHFHLGPFLWLATGHNSQIKAAGWVLFRLTGVRHATPRGTPARGCLGLGASCRFVRLQQVNSLALCLCVYECARRGNMPCASITHGSRFLYHKSL